MNVISEKLKKNKAKRYQLPYLKTLVIELFIILSNNLTFSYLQTVFLYDKPDSYLSDIEYSYLDT